MFTWISCAAVAGMIWYKIASGSPTWVVYWDRQTIGRFVFLGASFVALLLSAVRCRANHNRQWIYWVVLLLITAGLSSKLSGSLLSVWALNIDYNPWL